MSFVTVVRTDYGHLVQLLVKEYDEVADTTTVANLSGFTQKTLIIKKPDGNIVTASGVFVSDGSDGWFQANITQAMGVFDQTGYYEFQGLFENNQQRIHTSTFGEHVRIELY